MKYLFLDIDGVLNSLDFYERRPQTARPTSEIDPDAVALLAHIVKQTNAKVVISSSWRKIYSIAEIKSIISNATNDKYLELTESIIDETPHWVSIEDRPTMWQAVNYQRGYEIAKWMVEHDQHPDGIAILDDDTDMAWLIDYHVHTSHSYGLQNKHVHQVIDIMAKPVSNLWPGGY